MAVKNQKLDLMIRKSVRYNGLRPNPRFAAFALLTGLFVLKLILIRQLADHPLIQPDAGLDTTAYVTLARQVIGGNPALGPGLYFVSPLYIYFLAAGLAIFDSFTAVRVIQALLGTASVAFIFIMARTWFPERAAWIAAVLGGLTGLFTFYESLILQASVDGFLTAASLLALTLGLRQSEHRLKWIAAAGVLFGIAGLNRPNMLVAAVLVVLVMLGSKRWLLSVTLAGGLLAGLLPVTIRNIVVAGQWTLASSHGGLNFFIGNGEGATGFYRAVPGISPTIVGQERDTKRIAEQALGRPVTDAEASSYFSGLALGWMRSHPPAAVALLLKKFGYTFSAQHIALPHSYPFYAHDAGTLLPVLFVGPWLLIPLGLVGLFVPSARQHPGFFVWAAFVPAYAIAVAAFFVAERYRLPMLVPLCVTSGGAVDFALRARPRQLALPAAALAALFAAVNWPLGLDDGRWDEGVRLAQRLVILGRYDEADQWVRRMEPLEPRRGATRAAVNTQLLVEGQSARVTGTVDPTGQDDPDVLLRIGRRAAEANNPQAAEPFFRRAVRLSPGRADAHLQLGLTLLVLEKHAEAAGELAEAVRLEPNDPDALARLAYCELKLERLTDARAHAKAALALNPQDKLAGEILRILDR
jgi:Dolichyl-phosphate-mannose-protein mannosyltransferase/Tetratricopeptide repeat